MITSPPRLRKANNVIDDAFGIFKMLDESAGENHVKMIGGNVVCREEIGLQYLAFHSGSPQRGFRAGNACWGVIEAPDIRAEILGKVR